jgi:signal transduction histidine kinase
MARFPRSFAFRYTIVITGLLILLQAVIFGVLYWSTFTVYQWHIDATIESEADTLRSQFVDLDVEEMAAVITLRCTDEPGEFDEYLLASADYGFIAGNVKQWPHGVDTASGLIDVVIGPPGDGEPEPEIHRVRAVRLVSGHHLLVGRNLTELAKIRVLIRRALRRTVALTLLLGLGGGYVVSRGIAARVNRMNRGSRAILEGDFARRMEVSSRGDEFDVLARHLNAMLDRIEALMRGMREVIDNIAHDMRKPISRLRNRIEVTLMGARDADAYREALEQSIEDADHVLAMFNALLIIALAESGAPRERFEQIDLARIAHTTAEIYGPAAEEAGLVLDVHAEDRVPLMGDPHLIAQALANLLDNAVKYAAGTGTVSVEARRKGDRAVLVVADRGPGIPESFREQALERFKRLEESRTTPGIGLGLSLVRAVARLHDASIVLDDNRPGLEITLSFPSSGTRSIH